VTLEAKAAAAEAQSAAATARAVDLDQSTLTDGEDKAENETRESPEASARIDSRDNHRSGQDGDGRDLLAMLKEAKKLIKEIVEMLKSLVESQGADSDDQDRNDLEEIEKLFREMEDALKQGESEAPALISADLVLGPANETVDVSAASSGGNVNLMA